MTTTIPVHIASHLAQVVRDCLHDLDPDGDDPSCDGYRDALDQYDRHVGGEQIALPIGNHEEESE